MLATQPAAPPLTQLCPELRPELYHGTCSEAQQEPGWAQRLPRGLMQSALRVLLQPAWYSSERQPKLEAGPRSGLCTAAPPLYCPVRSKGTIRHDSAE